MSEERKRSGWRPALILLIALPLLYSLSIGPLCWLVTHDIISDHETIQNLAKLYVPLDWCDQHSATFKRVSDWYVNLWLPDELK